jgi:uncharacterized coiled-coil DUF342 family protein
LLIMYICILVKRRVAFEVASRRAYVRLRRMVTAHRELNELKRKVIDHDEAIRNLVAAIQELMTALPELRTASSDLAGRGRTERVRGAPGRRWWR